jgi:DNA-binding FadR family transcriptional regulator
MRISMEVMSADERDDMRGTRMHERAAVRLAADIVGGRLVPEEAFPSTEELVERFGFSRTVAREALQTLSMVGLVRVQHGRRTEVRPEADWNILTPVVQHALRLENRLELGWRDLYEFRMLLEPQAAAWMAQRGSERYVAQLSALAAEMRVLAENVVDAHRVLGLDQRFHRLIGDAAGNRVLAGVSRSFWDALSVIWHESHLSGEQFAAVAAQHERIADAIASRDPERASRAMEEHLHAASRMDAADLSPRRAEPPDARLSRSLQA